MGEDKALKPFLGRPLIERVMDRLKPIADEMIVTTNQPADYEFLGTRLVSDLKPDRGALGGLYTAVASARHPYVAVVACDMPFASKSFFENGIKFMEDEEPDVVIARLNEEGGMKSGGYEPLHALYRKETCLPAIEDAINKDLWKVIVWFPKVKVRALTPDEVNTLDPSGLCFWNLNTPEEFAEAEQRARQLD